MATIHVLSPKQNIKGTRIFLRVDWNIPLSAMDAVDSLKVSRSMETVIGLAKRGAVVIVATHLGRPTGREMKYSTKKLEEQITWQYNVNVNFIDAVLDTKTGLEKAQRIITEASPGTVFLLENVRFYAGEEKNTPSLAKAYASLAEVFVNDAFASCHRKHASVVGIAKLLPSYAGPQLVAEVEALQKLITKPKKPFVAIIGGAKISTKIGVIEALLKTASKVYIGGAMANAFFKAKKWEIGTSYVEKEGVAMAKKLLKNKNIILPIDVVVAKKKIDKNAKATTALTDKVKKNEAIGDIGPLTMQAWSADIREAETIVWNGPLGVSEFPSFSHGSLVIAQAIAVRSKGKAFGVIGGGDTLPVALATGMSEWYDHMSMGGGAMLEFLTEKGALPGIVALQRKSA